MSRRIVSILLILGTLTMTIGTFALPIQARADTTDVISQAGGCIGGAFIKGLVDKGLNALKDKVKDIASNYIKGILGSFISGLLSSSVPTNSSDPGLLGFMSNKYYRDDVIARCLARQIMDGITNKMSDIIKTRGRDGGSAFVANWTNFLTQAQYRGENIFRAELSTAQLCDYLNDDIKNSFGVDPKKKTPLTGQNVRTDSLQPFSLSAKCTMPVGFTPQKYQQDFAGNGGWGAFSRMLEPQNNAWGLTMLSQNEIARQRTLQQTADTTQATAGRGYTGISGNGPSDSCRVMSPTGMCLIYKDIKTTGDYLANSTAAAIGAEYSWLTTSQGLGTIIENITQNMIRRLFDQSDNTGGTTSDSPTIPVPTPVPPPPGGGGGVCADPGNTTPEHLAGLLAAESAALKNNPILADSLNDIANSTAYVSAVVLELKSLGFNASGNVKNGNDIIHPENLVAVWLSYNTTVERYEVVQHAGDEDMTISDANEADFSGKIPMSCAN